MSFFCPEPYKNLSAKTTGKWYPCCISGTDSAKFHNMNVRDHKILDFYNSDFMNKLRQDQLNGVMSEEVKINCDKCLTDERYGRNSRRLRMIEKYKEEDFSKLNLDSIKIKHIGNLCNAKCLTCAPSISSYLAQEMYDTGEYNGPIVIYDEITETYLEGLKEIIPFTNSIRLVGGEPIVNSRTWEFIEWLVKNNATQTELIFTTNGKVKFKLEQLRLLEKFKSVKISVSIDAYGERNNYIRFPSPFNKIIDNTKTYRNITDKIIITTCVSALNVGYLDELSEFIKSEFSNTIWVKDNIVQYPVIFRPEILPYSIKEKYLSSSILAREYLSLNNSSNIETFTNLITYLLKKDKLRSTNLFKMYPEFKGYETQSP